MNYRSWQSAGMNGLRKLLSRKWLLGVITSSVFGVALLVLAIVQYRGDDSHRVALVLGSEPSSLDPAISLTIDARTYISNMFEGLTSLGQSGEVLPGVAKSWSSNTDKTEYIFHLRDDAYWSDGSRVTAADFRYAWVRLLNPVTASGWSSYLYYIQGAQEYNRGSGRADDVAVEVVDDLTLKVSLVSPNSFFAAMTSLQPYLPVKQETIENNGDGWATQATSYISNGAYTLASWDHGSQIVLERNGQYWGKSNVRLAQITFRLMSDPNAIMSAYEGGDVVYVAKALTADQMSQVDKVQNANFVYTKFLSPNLDKEVLRDIRVRQAITLAINRDAVARTVGASYPLLSFVPHGFMNTAKRVDYRQDGYREAYLSSSADSTKARALLAEAGYSAGQPLSLVYLTNTSGANVALAEVIKSQLEEIGIRVDIRAYESKVFNSYRKARRYDIVAASWAAEYPDITSYLYGFLSDNLNNYAGYKSGEYDALYQRLLIAPEGASKYSLAHEAEDLIMDGYVTFPLYYQPDAYIADSKLAGYYQDPTGTLVLKNAYYRI